MRNIFLLIAGLLLVTGISAQTFQPATFTAEDSVTITVDVTGTKMAGQTEAYIWIFAYKTDNPADGANNGIVNGEWGSSGPLAKMTNVGNNKWQFGFTNGTTLFGKTPGELRFGFGFLVKNKGGSLQTNDYAGFKFDPIVFIPSAYRVFPGKLGASDVVNLYFHQDLATNVNEQRMTPTTVTVALFDNANNPIGQPKTWNLTNEGNKVYSYSFIPNFSWTIPNNTMVKKFTYRFDGAGRDTNGNPVTVTGTTNEKTIDALK